MESISEFRGKYAFLSNFWRGEVEVPEFGGRAFKGPSAEHVYQAMKAERIDSAFEVLSARTPGQAKRAGRRVRMRKDWDQIRIAAMHEVLKAKFARGSELAGHLLSTGEADLREGNSWGDDFWGVCSNEGQNWLGRLLMLRRSELAVATAPAVGTEEAQPASE